MNAMLSDMESHKGLMIEGDPDAPRLGLPLPLYTQISIGRARADVGKFSVVAGLGTELAAELKAKSTDLSDVEVQNYTNDPERFGQGTYEVWYAKDRTPFALVDEATGALAAVAWFGPESFAGAPALERGAEWHTAAWRSYAPYRGKGIMREFVNFALAAYSASRPDVRLWAGVDPANAASKGLAEKLGFTFSSEYSVPDEAVFIRG